MQQYHSMHSERDSFLSFYNCDYVISCLSDAIDANEWIHVCATIIKNIDF
jgi:hypothetical protein